MRRTPIVLLASILFLSACKPKIDNPKPTGTGTPAQNTITRDSHPGHLEKSILASDGNIAACGITNNGDAILVKFSTHHSNVILSKTYSESEVGIFTDLAETADGGYMICGMKKSDSGDYDVHVTRVDITGAILWQKSIGGPNDETNVHISHSTGNTFVVVAAQNNATYDIFDMWIESDGSQWNQVFDTSAHQIPYNVLFTKGHNTIITGIEYATVASRKKMYLLKLNETTLPTVTLSQNLNDGHTIAMHTIELTDGDLLTCGSVAHNGKVNGFIAKSNSNCQALWDKEYDADRNVILTSVMADGNNGYKATGVVYSEGENSTSQAILIAMDMQGKERWRKVYETGTGSGENAMAIFPLSDGGSILICNSVAGTEHSYFLMGVNPEGMLENVKK